MNVHRVVVSLRGPLNRWIAVALLLLVAAMVVGCAAGPKLVDHAFGFDARIDSPGFEILASLAIGQNVNAENIIMIRAQHEFRVPFPSDDYSADPRVQTYEFTGNHGDIGAFYDNGLSGLSLEAQTAVLQNLGLTLADVPLDRLHEGCVQ